MGKVRKINYGRRLLKSQANKSYEEGDYLSALHYTFLEMERYGGDADCYARLADSYENMGLYTSALNCWYRYADCCDPDDLPDAYEGLAVNYLNLGNEGQSAYYYERLVDSDSTLTGEDKLQIAEAFASDPQKGFRFVYPPKLADFREELSRSGIALKSGDLNVAIELLSSIAEGSKQYSAAQELLALAMLLKGDAEGAEEICLKLLKENRNNVQALATLSALYTEEDRKQESKEIANRLCLLKGSTVEEKYKIAAVACENGMHDKALELFSELEKEFPYEGNLLYFKSVAAAESGNDALAELSLERFTRIYPEAEVAKYYLKELRLHRITNGLHERPPFTYFYRIPEYAKIARTEAMKQFLSSKRNQTPEIAEEFLKGGFFDWTFDEMDGTERYLQSLALECAISGIRNGSESCGTFIRGILLDCSVDSTVKIYLLKMIYALNREERFGVVLCNLYKEMHIPHVIVGRKKSGLFLNAYAEVASKFGIIGERYQRKIVRGTEELYQALKNSEWLDLVKNDAKAENALSAAIYVCSDLREIGDSMKEICSFFNTSQEKVQKILIAAGRNEEMKKIGHPVKRTRGAASDTDEKTEI